MKENEVLARFMGHEIKEGWVTLYPGGEMNVCNLKYDKDWNDLMPVWYKFNAIQVNNITDQHYLSACKYAVGNAILEKGCAEACSLLAKAIEWYNANKQL